MPSFNKSSGVTIVELVISIAILSILSGAIYSVVNVRQQRQRTTDGIVRSNLQRTVEALELIRNTQGSYPVDVNSDGIPEGIDEYFAQGWLNDKPAGTFYFYWVNPARTTIGITVPLSTTRILKYHTSWAQIRECAPTAIASDNLCP